MWKPKLAIVKVMKTPELPMIMKNYGYEQQLLSLIQSDQIFGFCVCDVTTPAEIYNKIAWINFPPIIKRADIEESHLSNYMKERVKQENVKLPRTTVVQTYNGTQMLLFTPLIAFYMRLGLKISNVTKFIQYRPSRVLTDFVKSITDGRIEAILNQNQILALAFKIIGNAAYGKFGERVDRTKTVLGNDRKLQRLTKSALYKSDTVLAKEDGSHDTIEIEMDPRKIIDDKPITMAVAILQQSKLLFLMFVYDILWTYLVPGSFKLNYADTDSLCICKYSFQL